MKDLLLPSIRLMNRLPYRYKLTLVSLVFILPLMALSYLQVDAARDVKRETERRLSALQVLRGIVQMTQRLSDYQGLSALYLMESNSAIAVRRAMKARRLRLESEIESHFDHLTQATFDFDGGEKVRNRIGQWLQQWRKQQNSPFVTNDISQAFAHYNQPVSQGWLLARMTGYLSGLSRDGDRVNFGALSILLSNLRDAHQQIGQARVYGARVLRFSAVDWSMGDRLNALYETLLVEHERLMSALNFLLSEQSSMTAGGLQPATDQALQSVKQVADDLQTSLILGERLDTPWQDYYDKTGGHLALLEQLNDQMLGLVEENLLHRKLDQRQQLLVLLTAIAAIFLLSGYLYMGFNRALRDDINGFMGASRQLASGDLTTRFQVSGQDELGGLATELNGMIGRMQQVIAQLQEVMVAMADQTQSVAAMAQQSSEATGRQQQQTDQIASAMNEMATSVQEVTRTILAASEGARQVNDKALTGRQQMEGTLEAIRLLGEALDRAMQTVNRLVDRSERITRILDVIKEIAEQTNLLALNAAIEAARAGMQGRGFAVVADEVRTLANRTQQSTEDIETMIAELQVGVNDAVRIMHSSHGQARHITAESARVGEALNEMMAATESIVIMNSQIASAAEQQTAVAHEIDSNTQSIHQTSEQTAQGTRQTMEASERMRELAGRLEKLVALFKI